MSSFIGKRSGNRGRCVGSCRKQYELIDTTTNTVKTKVKNGNSFIELGTEFAPTGFGLGTEVIHLDTASVDDITGNGFYYGWNGLPDLLGYSFILHFDFGKYCYQLAFSLTDTAGYSNLFVRREKNAGVWGEWEWENPP